MDEALPSWGSTPGDAARTIVAVIALLIAGLVWAFGAVVGVGVLDGVPRDEYEPGDRFFFGAVLTGLSLGIVRDRTSGIGSPRDPVFVPLLR